MRFADSETQKLMRTTARSYLAGAYPPERLFRIESGVEEVDLNQMTDLGWFDLLAADGDGASLLETAVVIEELGYAGVPSPVAPINIAAYLLSSAGRPEAGTKSSTVSEGARLRADTSSLVLNNGTVTGKLPFVPFVDLSEDVLAPATVDAEAALVVVSLDGTHVEPLELLDRRCYSNVRFDSAHATIIATGVQAMGLRDQLDALSTAFGVIEMAGMMQRVLEMTSQYISQRVQFGQPIAKFQAARHRAAELLLQTETTRWAAYYGLWRFQQDPGDTDGIWLAKHWAVRAADRAYQISHLLHGGVGVGIDYPLHLYTQGVGALAVRAGTMNEMVDRTIESLRLEQSA